MERSSTGSGEAGSLAALMAEMSRDDRYGRILVAPTGRILNANRRALELFGYGGTSLREAPVSTLIPGRFRGSHDALRNVYAGDPHRRTGEGRRLFGLHRDGSDIPLDIGLEPVATEAGVFTLVVLSPAR